MSFIGNVPAEAYSPVVKDTFSGNGSTTDFTLSIPATTNSVNVYVENVAQEPTDAYTISGTTLSFTAAPVSGTDNIYVVHRGPAAQTVVPPAGVALSPSTVTATGDIITEGDLKVEVASGGTYTITGTDTASNRTLTLPDEAGTVLTSASTSNFPTGSVLQVVHESTDTEVVVSTTSYTDTTLTASITPISASSTILVFVNQQLRLDRSANQALGGIRVLRDATVIHDPLTGASGPFDFGFVSGGSSSAIFLTRASIHLEDDPSTTSAVTYKTQVRPNSTSDSGSATVQDSDTVDGKSYITLMEIAG